MRYHPAPFWGVLVLLALASRLLRAGAQVAFPVAKRTSKTDFRRLLGIGAVDLGGHQIDFCCSEYDYYYAIVNIGSPPQRAELVIDTGSSLTYLACKNTCTKCGHHDDPHFDTDFSKSLKWLDCDKSFCNRKSFGGLSCKSKQCAFSQSYLDGSFSEGRLFSDTIQMKASGELRNVTLKMGCTAREGGVILTQNADGVLGLGMDGIGVINQLKQSGVNEMVFSHCFTPTGQGVLVFGTIHEKDLPDEMFWEDLEQGHWAGVSPKAKTWYRLITKSFRVGTELVKEKNKIYKMNTFGGTVFDSGSTDIWLPSPLYDQVERLLKRQIELKVERQSSQFAICWRVEWEEALATFPKLTMEFTGGAIFEFTPRNYLVPKNDLQCLGIFRGSRGEGLALGSTAFLDKMVVHDRERGRLGWGNANCTLYQEKFMSDGFRAIPVEPLTVGGAETDSKKLGKPRVIRPKRLFQEDDLSLESGGTKEEMRAKLRQAGVHDPELGLSADPDALDDRFNARIEHVFGGLLLFGSGGVFGLMLNRYFCRGKVSKTPRRRRSKTVL